MTTRRFFSFLLIFATLLSVLTFPGAAVDASAAKTSDDQIHYININTANTSDCILIESNGETMLVDTSNPDASTGGAQAISNDSANVNEAIRYLRAMGIDSLDYVVLTHNHSDHIGGVTRLCQEGLIDSHTTVYYRTDAPSYEDIITPNWENRLYIRRALDALASVDANVVCLAEENITTLNLQLGDFSIDFLNLDADGDGVVDFSYDIENDNSIVLKVTKGSVDTLLTGDIEGAAEAALCNEIGQVEVLKVPHHGNRTSSSYEFLKTIQPETAILTSDGYWQYGAYEYLRSIGADIYTTGLCPELAIVEVVYDDSYEIENGVQYYVDSDDGWHSWVTDSYYVENGEVFRDGWKMISGTWYYFNEDGIMQTGEITENGITYTLSSSGALMGSTASFGFFSHKRR